MPLTNTPTGSTLGAFLQSPLGARMRMWRDTGVVILVWCNESATGEYDVSEGPYHPSGTAQWSSDLSSMQAAYQATAAIRLIVFTNTGGGGTPTLADPKPDAVSYPSQLVVEEYNYTNRGGAPRLVDFQRWYYRTAGQMPNTPEDVYLLVDVSGSLAYTGVLLDYWNGYSQFITWLQGLGLTVHAKALLTSAPWNLDDPPLHFAYENWLVHITTALNDYYS